MVVRDREHQRRHRERVKLGAAAAGSRRHQRTVLGLPALALAQQPRGYFRGRLRVLVSVRVAELQELP